jgi:hypothetical protein
MQDPLFRHEGAIRPDEYSIFLPGNRWNLNSKENWRRKLIPFSTHPMSRSEAKSIWAISTGVGKRGGRMMKRFPTAEELVASYWQKLARSVDKPAIRKSRAASPLRRRNSERMRHRIHVRVAA